MYKHIDAVNKKSKIRGLWRILFGHCKIAKNTVMFQSFFGMYNDNPKYISELLHLKYPDIQIIWVISDKNKSVLPSYIKTVEFESRDYYKWMYKSAVLVDNMAGFRHHDGSNSFIKRSIKSLIRIFAPQRRKKQYNICTWHGTPLKRLGFDRFDQNQLKVKRVKGSCDSIIAGCDFTAKVLKQAHFKEFDISFKMYGTPRNDILFNKNFNIIDLKKKLGLPCEKKIVLFAPTYRDDSVENSGVMQMNSFDFTKLFDTLEARFGGNWCFVFRLHHVVVTRININNLCLQDGQLLDGNLGDMAEYMACADVLLTDYSSSMFDFALTGRPCFLYAPDKEHYENDVRGFYFSMDKLPFSIGCTFEELLSNIKNFDEKEYKNGVESFLEKLGNVEDGHASERVVDDIKYFLDTGKKR